MVFQFCEQKRQNSLGFNQLWSTQIVRGQLNITSKEASYLVVIFLGANCMQQCV